MRNSLSRPDASPIAAAVFTDPIYLHDAVSDLRSAGFKDLSLAFSIEAKRGQQNDPRAQRAREKALFGETHSVPWRVRHGLEDDAHRHDPAVIARKNERQSSPCTEVDLQVTLQAMGVPQYRIDLISREIGASGSLLLVQAGDRSEQAQAILEKNCGINRTETATEH